MRNNNVTMIQGPFDLAVFYCTRASMIDCPSAWPGQQDRKTTENMKLPHTGVEWTHNTPPPLRAASYTKHSFSIYPVRYI